MIDREGQIKGKHLKARKDENWQSNPIEYFIKYDTGGSKINSVQGVVIEAENAKQALDTLNDLLPYFKLLYIRRV